MMNISAKFWNQIVCKILKLFTHWEDINEIIFLIQRKITHARAHIYAYTGVRSFFGHIIKAVMPPNKALNTNLIDIFIAIKLKPHSIHAFLRRSHFNWPASSSNVTTTNNKSYNMTKLTIVTKYPVKLSQQDQVSICDNQHCHTSYHFTKVETPNEW